MARFYIEPNGHGGWITRDRRHPTNIVASSAFREFASKAADRLNFSEGREAAEWFRFYGVASAEPVTEPDTLAGQPVAQALVPGVAPVSQAARQLEAEAHRRNARRGHASPPAGGLFDDVARNQLDLF